MKIDDVLPFLSEARIQVKDDRSIWCLPSHTYQTSIEYKYGFIFGGAISPLLLRDSNSPVFNVPWCSHYSTVRVVGIDKSKIGIPDVLPIMELAVQNKESLLLISHDVEPDLVAAVVLNDVKNTLRCSIVTNPSDRSTMFSPLTWNFSSKEKLTDLSRFPFFEEVWVRRSASVLIPRAGDEDPSMERIALISIGGNNYEHQQDRLRAVLEEIKM